MDNKNAQTLSFTLCSKIAALFSHPLCQENKMRHWGPLNYLSSSPWLCKVRVIQVILTVTVTKGNQNKPYSTKQNQTHLNQTNHKRVEHSYQALCCTIESDLQYFQNNKRTLSRDLAITKRNPEMKPLEEPRYYQVW